MCCVLTDNIEPEMVAIYVTRFQQCQHVPHLIAVRDEQFNGLTAANCGCAVALG